MAVIAMPGIEPVLLVPDADFAGPIRASRSIACRRGIQGPRWRRIFARVATVGLIPGAVIAKPCAIAASFVTAIIDGTAGFIDRAARGAAFPIILPGEAQRRLAAIIVGAGVLRRPAMPDVTSRPDGLGFARWLAGRRFGPGGRVGSRRYDLRLGFRQRSGRRLGGHFRFGRGDGFGGPGWRRIAGRGQHKDGRQGKSSGHQSRSGHASLHSLWRSISLLRGNEWRIYAISGELGSLS